MATHWWWRHQPDQANTCSMSVTTGSSRCRHSCRIFGTVSPRPGRGPVGKLSSCPIPRAFLGCPEGQEVCPHHAEGARIIGGSSSGRCALRTSSLTISKALSIRQRLPAAHMQRSVGRHVRGIEEDALPHLGPGLAADPTTPDPETTAGGRPRPAGVLGGGDTGPGVGAGPAAAPRGTVVQPGA